MPEAAPVTGYVLKMYPRFSETFIVSEILAREARGERIVIFSLRPTTDARFHPELARVKAPVIHLDRPSSSARLWGMLTAAAGPHLGELLQHDHDVAGQAVQLARRAGELGVTHLHAHFASVATTVARLAARVADLPYSFTAHAKDIFHESVEHRDLAVKFADAHHAVTISRHNLSHLTRSFPAAADRIRLVYNGLEVQRFPFAPQRAETPTLLAVGRLVEKKGFSLLIEAVRRLRADGTPVTAEIVGDGMLHEELSAQIAEAGLVGVVRLLGPLTQTEVAELLGRRRVFVAPFVIGADGNADGLPTVLLEAMARGIRCVAADVTGVGEVIRPAETGWLVPSGDISALTEAVAAAVQPGGEHDHLVHRARALVEHNFDSRRQAAELQALAAAPRQVDSEEGTIV